MYESPIALQDRRTRLLANHEWDMTTWYRFFKAHWKQGEHVTLMGQTGTGKTSIAHLILDNREDVCVLAVKYQDETIERFLDGTQYGHASYKLIKKWPPEFVHRKVVLWIKPDELADKQQASGIYKALNTMYKEGCWCIYFDEAGFISGSLGLGKALGVLLNQGRSGGISVVASMTRPSSVVAQVPKEAFSQCRHIIVFKYTSKQEIKSCAEICGIDFKDVSIHSPASMDQLQAELRTHQGQYGLYSDFLYIYDGTVHIVRNEDYRSSFWTGEESRVN